MANIFETARAERAYSKYVKGLESVAGLVETEGRRTMFNALKNSCGFWDLASSLEPQTMIRHECLPCLPETGTHADAGIHSR